ncbi:arrestin domain-containing protein 17-like [Gigantopelta aegis]|uniref:arrestin domain-containing protein 17-like n=1 Tax=Gigantopelta aegis TaxID=1735272 RepID=UPI001B889CC5|nr:arrestin domain-containing protein 17-like [Gigantopelta aegis]XP_041375091.1 arrestin domain-containing protein 17-like [Gigantopelta aegis]
MKLEKFEISFDNTRGVFCSGEQVKGNVIISLKQPMKMKKITLYFEGRSKSHWEVKHGRSKTDYRANEPYIHHVMLLFGNDETSQEHAAGYHTYPFSLMLSPNLPSSFEGRRGYVRYFCKASINRPWKFDEHTKRAFTVIHHLDLNFLPEATMPIVAEQEQAIEGFCCSAGYVSARLQLAKTGYVPGEPLAYNIDVYNKSDNKVDKIQLELKQVVTYTGYSDSLFSSGHPKQHTKIDQFSLCSHSCNLKKNTEEHLNRIATIPSLPPSKMEGCSIIDITYFLSLIVSVGWTNITVERMIIIGTVPIQQFHSFSIVPSTEPTAPPLEPPDYSEPPPSYEESVFHSAPMGDEPEEAHTTGGMTNWAPSYIYYNWNQPAQAIPTIPPPAYNQL